MGGEIGQGYTFSLLEVPVECIDHHRDGNDTLTVGKQSYHVAVAVFIHLHLPWLCMQ